MILRSGNFKGNFLLLAIKWRLRSSFYNANRYKFSSFFVCLFVRFFFMFANFLVTWILYSKGKQLSREMLFFGKKSFRKTFLPLTRVLSTLLHAKGIMSMRNPVTWRIFILVTWRKKVGFKAFSNANCACSTRWNFFKIGTFVGFLCFSVILK